MEEVKWDVRLSTTETNNVGSIKPRQNNTNSEVIRVQIINGQGKPYDLTALSVFFVTSFKASDDLNNPVQKATTVVDAKNGIIDYVFDDDAMQRAGRQEAYFEIYDYDEFLNTTQRFSYDIQPSVRMVKADLKSELITWDEANKMLKENTAKVLSDKTNNLELKKANLADVNKYVSELNEKNEKLSSDKADKKDVENGLSLKTDNTTFTSTTNDLKKQISNAQSGYIGDYDSESALKQDYPGGKQGYAVVWLTENGKKVGYAYTYVKDKWTKGSVWNGMGIPDDSISEQKLQNDSVGVNKIQKWSVTKGKMKGQAVSCSNVDFLKIGKNVFNQNNVTKNRAMPADGSIELRDNFFYGEPIFVDSNTNYVENILNDGLYVNFYDSDNRFINGIIAGYDSQPSNFKTPGNAQYMVVSGHVRHLPTLQIEKGTTSTTYEPFSAEAIGFTAEDKRMRTLPRMNISKNMIVGGWIEGEGYDEFTGEPIQVRTLKRTDLIECDGLATYTLSGTGITGINIVEYTKSKVFQQLIGDSTSGMTITTQLDTKYLGLVVNIGATDIQLEFGDTATDYQEAGVIEYLKVPYLEKKIDNIGEIQNKKYNPKVTTNRSLLSLKNLNKELYLNIKKPSKDIVIKKIQDSIGVSSQGYQSNREDAAFRPPMCEQWSEFSYMVEMLLPKGQRYYRYDSSVFTETADAIETKSYDDYWDWLPTDSKTVSAINNRPALTRVLTSSSNATLSYTIPTDAYRCDYIYRTDCKNAESVTVSISAGDGFVQVYDETTSQYVEANGYSFSQRENDTIINADTSKTQGKIALRKSVYQKTLKMVCLKNDKRAKVTLTNNGSGRLTYWGIQTSHLPYMVDFKNVSRGGHNIYELSLFEEWDMDYDKPSLIFAGNPIINEGFSFNNGNPANWGISPTNYAKKFVDWATKYKNKDYSPFIINGSYFCHEGSGAISKADNTLNYAKYQQYKFDCDNVYAEIEKQMNEADITHINFFDFVFEEVKAKAELEGLNWYEALWKGWDSTSTNASLCYDGTHPNDLMARLYFEIAKNMFR